MILRNFGLYKCSQMFAYILLLILSTADYYSSADPKLDLISPARYL